MFWVTFDFERKYIKKWENGCFTVTLELLSQEATTICSILDADSSVYSEKISGTKKLVAGPVRKVVVFKSGYSWLQQMAKLS